MFESAAQYSGAFGTFITENEVVSAAATHATLSRPRPVTSATIGCSADAVNTARALGPCRPQYSIWPEMLEVQNAARSAANSLGRVVYSL